MKLVEEKITFDNGVRLVLEPVASVRSVCVGIWVNAGAVYERESNNGVSHFLEHLLFKGTRERTAFEIAETMDAIGGNLNAFSSKEFTCYFAKVRDEHWRLTIDVLADMIKNSLLDEKEIDKERHVIEEEIKMYEDAPDEIIHDIFTQSMFRGSTVGYPILGTREIISSIPRDAIVDYLTRHYTGPNLVITLSGRFDPVEVKEYVLEAFSDVARGSGECIDMARPKPSFDRVIRPKEIEQVHLILGTASTSELDDDRYKVSVLTTLLGGGMSSRLFQDVREERGLAYSIYAYTTRFRNAGLFAVYAGCSAAEAPTVVEVVAGHLMRLRREPVDPRELTRAKEQMKGNIILGLESTNARMNRLGRNEMYFRKQIPIDEVLQRIDAVTREDLLEVSERYFHGDGVGLTVIGPVEDEAPLVRALEGIGA